MIIPSDYLSDNSKKKFTYEEFEALDLPERREFINGNIYLGEREEKYTRGEIVNMSPSPRLSHQKIIGRIYSRILGYIDGSSGKCEPYISPADVKLNDNNTVQPDIFVACDPDKVKENYHDGAPDWVIEVLSPSTVKRDTGEKLHLYLENGVREYWIIDPMDRRVIVYPFEENTNPEIYTFEHTITVHIYKNNPEPLTVRLADYFEE